MKKRVISAIIMILLFVPLVLLGGIPYLILFSTMGLLCLKELLDLEKNIPVIFKISAYFFSLFLILYNYGDNTINYLLNPKFFIFMGLFYYIGVVIFGKNKKYNFKDAIFLLSAITLIGISFNGFMIVRNFGWVQIVYLFLIACLTDTFALLCGKYFGKHQLSEMSPKKTWEGSIGGSILGTVFTALVYCLLTGLWHKLLIIMGVTFVLSILGQCGDLFFSSIKRHYGIKDYSNLIPGHGGMLDRVDSVIFVLLGYIIILI